ncbi:MAG: hypothetical protein KDD94_01215 [Calditrichaeota bacterium]|nr:hypothetical protein [Calditrichota bacterium]
MNIIFLISILFVSCKTQIKQPKRPYNVPVNAVWEGGNDGGNWIYIEERDKNLFYCKIYNDYDGTQLDEGFFKYEGEPLIVDSIKKYLGVYVGPQINLKNGKVIKKISLREVIEKEVSFDNQSKTIKVIDKRLRDAPYRIIKVLIADKLIYSQDVGSPDDGNYFVDFVDFNSDGYEDMFIKLADESGSDLLILMNKSNKEIVKGLQPEEGRYFMNNELQNIDLTKRPLGTYLEKRSPDFIITNKDEVTFNHIYHILDYNRSLYLHPTFKIDKNLIFHPYKWVKYEN